MSRATNSEILVITMDLQQALPTPYLSSETMLQSVKYGHSTLASIFATLILLSCMSD